jgi:hypothetical protein
MYTHMLSNLANFRQKIMAGQLIVKLVLLTSFGLFLPMQSFATETLEITHVEISAIRDQATISWHTNLNATARVDYGLATEYGSYVDDTSANSKNHSINIANLDSDKTYHLKVSSNAHGQYVSTFDMILETEDYNDGDKAEIENFDEAYITGTTATLHWETNEKTTAKVFYGLTTDYGKTINIKGKKEAFELVITKLLPDTIYFYKVEVKDEDGNLRSRSGQFETLDNEDVDRKVLEISRVQPITNNDEAISFTSATISWHANKLADGFVRFGTSANKLNKKVDNNVLFRDFNQTAHISKLKDNTVYYFQVEVKDIFGKTVKSNIYSFKTKDLPDNIKQAAQAPTKITQLRKLFTPATSLYKDAGNGNIYAIVNNQKHLIFNSEFFSRYGYSTKKIKTVAANFLNNFSNIRLVKDPTNNKVYYLAKKDNDRLLKIDIPSPSVFSSYPSNKWDQVVTIDKQELDNYANVQLVKAKDSKTVYLLDNGFKRAITSAGVFESHGYKWSDILEVSQAHLDSYMTGTSLH